LNAGLSEPSQIAEITLEYFDVNVRGMVFGFQAPLPAMTDGGSIVLVGSIAGNAGYSGLSASSHAIACLRCCSFG
jgi:NADP-dependent 3-hydroxy acid dehydrogenase YdfG